MSSDEYTIANHMTDMNQYMRNFMTVFIAWFTFFCGYNMVIFPSVAIGYHKDLPADAVILICYWFLIQNILAITASVGTAIHCHLVIRKIEKKMPIFDKVQAKSPYRFWNFAVWLMTIVYLSSTTMWIVFTSKVTDAVGYWPF